MRITCSKAKKTFGSIKSRIFAARQEKQDVKREK